MTIKISRVQRNENENYLYIFSDWTGKEQEQTELIEGMRSEESFVELLSEMEKCVPFSKLFEKSREAMRMNERYIW